MLEVFVVSRHILVDLMDVCPLNCGSLSWGPLSLDLLLADLKEIVGVQGGLLLQDRGLLRCEIAPRLDGRVERTFEVSHASGCYSSCLIRRRVSSLAAPQILGSIPSFELR